MKAVFFGKLNDTHTQDVGLEVLRETSFIGTEHRAASEILKTASLSKHQQYHSQVGMIKKA